MTVDVSRRAPAPGDPGERPASGTVRPVAVRVLTDDELLAEGARAYLAGRSEVDLTSAAAGPVDVLLAVGDEFDQAMRERIDAALAAAPDTGPAPRLVLVVRSIAEPHLWWAVGRGLTGVLPRSTANWNDVVAGVLRAREGLADIPPSATGWLLEQVRRLDADVLRPAGVTSSGLTTREVEIVRLLAQGLETTEVARELNYSERTIKEALRSVKARFGLRNRAQIVAHAVRIGAV